jgi:hypothetical protein
MDRYQQQNAAHKIDGYFTPRLDEATPPAFERAKQECLLHLREAMNQVEQLSVTQFMDARHQF